MANLRKILIIEDDNWFADTLSSLLSSKGFETQVSPHVVAAIKDVDEFKPQIIIVDLLLAGSTAFTLLNEFQSHSDLADIPVIVCSNISEHLKLEDLQPYGVKALIDKAQMQPEDIIVSIRRLEDGTSKE